MATSSTSGLSSRSTLIETKWSFRSLAVASSSNDSRSMTWHQWQEEYPTERNTGRSNALALENASSPHGYQSTGLWACRRRYGDDSAPRRFTGLTCGLSPRADPSRTGKELDRASRGSEESPSRPVPDRRITPGGL